MIGLRPFFVIVIPLAIILTVMNAIVYNDYLEKEKEKLDILYELAFYDGLSLNKDIMLSPDLESFDHELFESKVTHEFDDISRTNDEMRESLAELKEDLDYNRLSVITEIKEELEESRKRAEQSKQEAEMWQIVSIVIGISTAASFFVIGRRTP